LKRLTFSSSQLKSGRYFSHVQLNIYAKIIINILSVETTIFGSGGTLLHF